MTDKQALRDIAEKTKIAGEAPVMPFEQRINALNDFMKHFTPAAALALLDELEALQSFRTAYMEWSDKTDWVQTDKRLDVIKPWGKHRADVLKLYIDHLESNLEAAEQCIAELEAREVKLPELKMLRDYLAEVTMREREDILVGIRLEFFRALEEAGVKAAAAAGKGEA